MKYLRALVIFLFGSLLVIAVAGIAGSILVAALPTESPAPAFAIAGVILILGVAAVGFGAIKSLWRTVRYERCPACAMDVRGVGPGADGKLRCPGCGQWL